MPTFGVHVLYIFTLFSLIYLSYGQLPTLYRGYVQNNGDSDNPMTDVDYYRVRGIQVPKRVHAMLLRTRVPKRTNFNGKDFKFQMELMGAHKIDEKGHLVGSQFGGPAEAYNLVPMSNSQNRNFHSTYISTFSFYDLEMRMSDYLSLQCGMIDFEVHINYCDYQQNWN